MRYIIQNLRRISIILYCILFEHFLEICVDAKAPPRRSLISTHDVIMLSNIT